MISLIYRNSFRSLSKSCSRNLFLFQDYLRDENREVNHHGRVRTLGDDSGDEGEGVDMPLRNNWVDDEQLKLDLVSRREDVQVFFLWNLTHSIVDQNIQRLQH